MNFDDDIIHSKRALVPFFRNICCCMPQNGDKSSLFLQGLAGISFYINLVLYDECKPLGFHRKADQIKALLGSADMVKNMVLVPNTIATLLASTKLLTFSVIVCYYIYFLLDVSFD